jgi:chromosomal replication initiation ATPase DnaA
LIGWTCGEVMEAVAQVMGVDVESIRRGKRGRTNASRQVAMVLCIDRARASMKEIAEAFQVRDSGVSSLGAVYRKHRAEDVKLRTCMSAVLELINQKGQYRSTTQLRT